MILKCFTEIYQMKTRYKHIKTNEYITVTKIKGLVVKYKTSLDETKYMALKLFEANYIKN